MKVKNSAGTAQNSARAENSAGNSAREWPDGSTWDRLARFALPTLNLGARPRTLDRLDLAVYSAGLAGPCLAGGIVGLGRVDLRAVARMLPGRRR